MRKSFPQDELLDSVSLDDLAEVTEIMFAADANKDKVHPVKRDHKRDSYFSSGSHFIMQPCYIPLDFEDK